MKTTLASLFSVLTLPLARAQAPSGTYSYDISADTGGPLLWNVTGVELFDPLIATVDRQDSWGTLWSSHWPIGQLRGDGTNTFVRAWFQNSSWEQQFFPFGGIALFQTGSLDLTLDTNSFALSGTQTLREKRVEISFFHRTLLSSSNETSEVSFPLTDGNDGHWNLQLNLTPWGSYIRGDATITFANDETQRFCVMVKYPSLSAQSNFPTPVRFFDLV